MKFMLALAVLAVFACAVYAENVEEPQNVELQPDNAKRDKRGFLAAPLAAPLALPAAYAAYPAPLAAYHAAPLAYSAPYIAAPYAKAIAAPALAGYTVLG